MKLSSKIMLFGLGLFLVAAMIVPPSSNSSGGPAVTIQNTPLPVQGTVGVNNFPANQVVSGTVSVGNIPSVNVANTPTVNFAGGGSVNVSNPADSQSNPAPLVTLEAAQPYEDFCTNLLAPGAYGWTNCQLQYVPSGKRLVIQEVDADVSIDTGLKPALLAIATSTPSGGHYHYLTATYMGTAFGDDHFGSHQETRLYVGPTQAPSCQFYLAGPTVETDTFTCAISGFLVDTQ